jgi:vancomycin resistance protein YoaR
MTELTFRVARSRRRRRARRARRVGVAVGLMLLAAAVTLLVRTIVYQGQTMPGVRVLGVDVGGRSRAAAARRIRAAVDARLAQPVSVVAGDRLLSLRPSRVLAVDVKTTTDAALRAGQASFLSRSAALMTPVALTTDVVPTLRIRRVAAGAYLEGLGDLGKPPVDATVSLRGLTPAVVPARAGTAPEGNRLLDALERAVLAGRHVVHVHFRPQPAAISTVAARAAAAEASAMVGQPIALTAHGQGVGTLSPTELAGLIRFAPAHAGYRVSFDRARLASRLEPLVRPWKRDPVDAGFAVSGSSVRIVPAQNGADLDGGAALASVTKAARSAGTRQAALELSAVAPPLTTKAAQKLGIRQKLVSYTTQMGASSANRIHNVHLMADYIDGTVIKPGETFSFNRVVGPRTAERGFLEGQMIVGTLTLPAIGGGVCQTATTLFNDAFEAGLPILARINHGYYLAHYPLGRDATVSWGGPDLVFRNDLHHGILIKSSYTDSTLTFTFYGTPQGRHVTSVTGPQTNWTSPTMSYAYNPYAAPGSVQVVSGSGERGFDVDVSRTVTQNGRVLRNDSFASHYIPVGPTTVYGPGRHIPGPYVVLPRPPS